MDAIHIRNLSHQYDGRVDRALKNINLDIRASAVTILLGASGSGKSTFLRSINRLIEPEEGQIVINNQDILACGTHKVEEIRQSIGMIFQQFNLVERDTVLKNVLNGRLSYVRTLPGIFSRFSSEDYDIVYDCLRRVGLIEYAHYRAGSLSGGQKQRVAIARALAQCPRIILADEPVSSLDPKLMRETMDLLQTICQEENITLVVSLHFLELARLYATHMVGMRDGEIVFDDVPDELTDGELIKIYGKTRDWHLYGKLGY